MDYTLQELAEISATQHPGVSEAAIKEAEQALGAVFPQQYRELVKLINAPEFFDWSFFPIKDRTHPAESWDDIVQHNTGNQRPKFLLPDYIAFAESVGDYLCFKVVQGKMIDTVYVHAEETKAPEEIAPDLKTALIDIMSYAEENDIDLLDPYHDHEKDTHDLL